MRAVRHLSYLLLVPAINGFVDKMASWWNAKQGCRGSNIHVCGIAIQGLFTRHRIGFNQKWITAARLWPRVYPFCWIPLPETRLDILYVVCHLEPYLTLLHIWPLLFFFFSFHDEPLSFTETSLCPNSFTKYFYFSLDPHFCFAETSTLRVSIRPGTPAPCKHCMFIKSRLKLVSIYPGILKRGLHIYYLLIYLSLLWCHM